MTPRPITSTYRLQLRGPQADPSGKGQAFTFADATALIPYFTSLGVSHLYLSPILTAMPNSNHNYDVIDPTTVNPELGGIEGLRKLAASAHAAGLGLIIDIVPNHMSVEVPRANRWWWDVLKYGQDSAFAHYFDINWSPDNRADGKLALPVLGAPGDEAEFRLTREDGEDMLAYFDHRFPLRPGTYASLADAPLDVYSRQPYRLTYWRDGIISYRRFFSVNTLAGLRQEDPSVFAHTHRLVGELVRDGLVDGIRVDHPDGLSDPDGYLRQLRTLVGDNCLILVEKILGVDEALEPSLPVEGTSGYDALREFDGVFVNAAAEEDFSRLALEFSGRRWDGADIDAAERELKKDTALTELAAELDRLAAAIRRDAAATLPAPAVTDEELTAALAALVAHMPVYRGDYRGLSRLCARGIAKQMRENPDFQPALELITAGLLTTGEAHTRFAQVCGAVMAKGVEDTLFYRACRLVALQEVGGAPGRFGISPAEFHHLQHERATIWPLAMTTLSTHDTKRSEDVRARIIGLSEFAGEFGTLARALLNAHPAPDPTTGYFLLQNLLGAWPTQPNPTEPTWRERMIDYSLKAARESGEHTTWYDNNDAFESALAQWIRALTTDPAACAQVSEFLAPVIHATRTIILGRKLLQLAAPGIPDTYQGQELADDSLVDPDNRRFIDYAYRQGLLAAPRAQALDWRDNFDAALQHITRQVLQLRRAVPALAQTGGYRPIFAQGPKSQHLVGFSRTCASEPAHSLIALATRLPHALADAWSHTTINLPPGTWTDILTGTTFTVSAADSAISVASLFEAFPCALLVPGSLAETLDFLPAP